MLDDEDTKPMCNHTNARCVFCGGKTEPLFNTLRWCPDCEKDSEEINWASVPDDGGFELHAIGSCFNLYNINVSKCQHEVDHCRLCCRIEECADCGSHGLWSL